MVLQSFKFNKIIFFGQKEIVSQRDSDLLHWKSHSYYDVRSDCWSWPLQQFALN